MFEAQRKRKYSAINQLYDSIDVGRERCRASHGEVMCFVFVYWLLSHHQEHSENIPGQMINHGRKIVLKSTGILRQKPSVVGND